MRNAWDFRYCFIWEAICKVTTGVTYFISVQQILEELSIHKTKLLLKLNEKIKVLENLKSGHSCIKYVFLVSEYICDVFENLPEFRDWINQFQTIRKKTYAPKAPKPTVNLVEDGRFCQIVFAISFCNSRVKKKWSRRA